jgi:sorbitol/mannitol transport system substrate-binding protein
MMIYRKDFAYKASLPLSHRPKWTEVRALAAKIRHPKNGTYRFFLSAANRAVAIT